MQPNLTPCRIITDCEPNQIPAEILQSDQPVVLKGLVRDWPLVTLSSAGPSKVAAYLRHYYNGQATQIFQGEPQHKGRYFYNDDATQLNFDIRLGQITEVLQSMLDWYELAEPPSIYVASNLLRSHFPDLPDHQRLQIPGAVAGEFITPDRVSIWLGNRSVAACHFDTSENIACCIMGQRRFTLFPPEQIANLYPGPMAPTPGGQVISMVDFEQPDLDRFPHFPDAMAAAYVAELDSGDALYLPSMWWHQVEALSPFNILINYWWSRAPRYTGSGMTLLYHALLCLRDKPPHERKAWQAILNYYIFDTPEHAAAHIPPAAQGVLGQLDELHARQLRAMLLNQLNR